MWSDKKIISRTYFKICHLFKPHKTIKLHTYCKIHRKWLTGQTVNSSSGERYHIGVKNFFFTFYSDNIGNTNMLLPGFYILMYIFENIKNASQIIWYACYEFPTNPFSTKHARIRKRPNPSLNSSCLESCPAATAQGTRSSLPPRSRPERRPHKPGKLVLPSLNEMFWHSCVFLNIISRVPIKIYAHNSIPLKFSILTLWLL